jgi:hypothetical protein
LSVRLTRADFERRYAAMPQLKKAELIEGVAPIYWGLMRAETALLKYYQRLRAS